MQHVYPTNTQLLLVNALLASDQEFSEQWTYWKKECGPYADLDEGSLRLFPLVYKKLAQALPDDPWVQVTENAYRFHWLRNVYLMSECEKIIQQLEQHDIPYLLLKGGAFLSLYYDGEVGVRSLDDIDIFIPTSHFVRAIKLVCQHAEYQTHTDIQFFRSDFFHEITLYTPRGLVDMHCHAFRTYLLDDDWEVLQQDIQTISSMGHTMLTLSDTDHFVHVCAYALQWNEVSNLRWIIDAVLIARKGLVDWDRVVYLVKKLRVSPSVYDALVYLQEHHFIAVPDWVLRDISAIPVSLVDKRLYQVTLKDTTSHPIAALELYWWRYIASLRKPMSLTDMLQKLCGFMKFLCQTDSAIRIPGIVMLRTGELLIRWWKQSFSV